MAHEVFLCHSARDKAIADAACAALEAQRISCWIAPRDVLAGDEWGKSIIEALSTSNIVVLIFSGHANESPQVRREIERAVSKSKIIVPFRIENVLPSDAMEYALGNTHWLDAMSPPMEQSLSNLCQTISRLLQRQHPLQPMWKPGDEAAVAEVQVEKATPKVEPLVSRLVERATGVPVAVEPPPSRAVGDSASSQIVSGERIVSPPLNAVPPPVPLVPVQRPAPPATVQPTVLSEPVRPPVPVAAPQYVAPVAAGAHAGSKGWVWGVTIAVIAALGLVAFAVPRLRRAEVPADSPAASTTVAPGPDAAPSQPTAPAFAPTPAPDARVDQPALAAEAPAPDSATTPTAAAKAAVATPAPVKTTNSAVVAAVKQGPPPTVGDVKKLYAEGNFADAMPLAKEVCGGGAPRGCMIAGNMFQRGEGRTKDDGQAMAFYQKACDLGEPLGCSVLGLMYENGNGVAQDYGHALALYRKGCDGGYRASCTNLGVMYEGGQGVSQDYAQAVAVYRKGCNGGDLRGCSNLGSLYLSGKGVARDHVQAINLYRQACKGEYMPACGYLNTYNVASPN